MPTEVLCLRREGDRVPPPVPIRSGRHPLAEQHRSTVRLLPLPGPHAGHGRRHGEDRVATRTPAAHEVEEAIMRSPVLIEMLHWVGPCAWVLGHQSAITHTPRNLGDNTQVGVAMGVFNDEVPIPPVLKCVADSMRTQGPDQFIRMFSWMIQHDDETILTMDDFYRKIPQ